MPIYSINQKPRKKPNKKKNVSSAPLSIPRIKVLSRELLPVIGKNSLKSSLDKELSEFRNIQDTLPSLEFIKNSENKILQSYIQSFTISGEPMGYFLDAECDGKLTPMFLKRVHLVDPIKSMEGLYALPNDGGLPNENRLYWENTISKIHSRYNEAYVDTLCSATLSRLVETDTSPHWCKFYGTFNGRADKYMYNITGEISSLKHRRWFVKNRKEGKFRIIVAGEDKHQKPLIHIVDDAGEIDCISLENTTDEVNELNDLKKEKQEKNVSDCSDSCGCVSESPSTDEEGEIEILEERPVRIIKLEDENFTDSFSESGSESSSSASSHLNGSTSDYATTTASASTSSTSSTSSTASSSSTQNETDYFVEFSDYPVQVTMMERCKATMDSLLDIEEDSPNSESKDTRWSAWIYQVIAGLTVAQYHYGFVHNDLHTNNIMWQDTSEPYIYYRLTDLNKPDKYFKVPTFGKIMKIIDFGRASFWLQDRNSLIISDSFEDGNDAGGQYNCEPFYDPSETKVDPNPSFDLCRMAVSMFDALYPESPPLDDVPEKLTSEPGRVTFESQSKLHDLLWLWLTDTEGKNILRNPDDSERFPDFDLYKHIARYANNCVPRKEAQNAYFNALYNIDKAPTDAKVWELPLN